MTDSPELLAAVLDTLTSDEMRYVLAFFAGWDPQAFTAALELTSVDLRLGGDPQ
jgi:hypothetical protein